MPDWLAHYGTDDMIAGGSCAPSTDLSTYAWRVVDVVDAPIQVDETWGRCDPCPPPVPGCTDPDASNYDAAATEDDGSCTYEVTFSVDMSCSGLAP